MWVLITRGGIGREEGEGWMRLLYTLPLHEPGDMSAVWQYAKRSIFWWTLRKRESWLTMIWTRGVAENPMMSRRFRQIGSKWEMLTDPQQPSPPITQGLLPLSYLVFSFCLVFRTSFRNTSLPKNVSLSACELKSSVRLFSGNPFFRCY